MIHWHEHAPYDINWGLLKYLGFDVERGVWKLGIKAPYFDTEWALILSF